MHNYIAGQWTRSGATETVPVINPATGEELGRTPLSPAAEVDRRRRRRPARFRPGGACPSPSASSTCSS